MVFDPYKDLQDSMENNFDEKIYNDKKEIMRERLRKWAGSHLTGKNEAVFNQIANKLYDDTFERYRTKEGYTIIKFKYGKRFVLRDDRGRIKKWYK